MSKQHPHKPKKYLRKTAVAERYSVDERTIDRMRGDGRLPKPDLYNGRFPLWGEDSLDENDRRGALLPRPTQAALNAKHRPVLGGARIFTTTESRALAGLTAAN